MQNVHLWSGAGCGGTESTELGVEPEKRQEILSALRAWMEISSIVTHRTAQFKKL